VEERDRVILKSKKTFYYKTNFKCHMTFNFKRSISGVTNEGKLYGSTYGLLCLEPCDFVFGEKR
jgi:hypothetical protein